MQNWIHTAGVIVALATVPLVHAEPGFRGQREGFGQHGFSKGAWVQWMLRNDEVAREAGVTDDQLAQLRGMVFATQEVLIRTKADHALARLELQKLLSEDTPDEAAVLEAVEKAGHFRTELKKERLRQYLQVRGLLGQETMASLREAYKDRVDRFDRRGRGSRGKHHGRHPRFGTDRPGDGPPWLREAMPPPGEDDEATD